MDYSFFFRFARSSVSPLAFLILTGARFAWLLSEKREETYAGLGERPSLDLRLKGLESESLNQLNWVVEKINI